MKSRRLLTVLLITCLLLFNIGPVFAEDGLLLVEEEQAPVEVIDEELPALDEALPEEVEPTDFEDQLPSEMDVESVVDDTVEFSEERIIVVYNEDLSHEEITAEVEENNDQVEEFIDTGAYDTMTVVNLEDGTSVEEAVAYYAADEDVAYAQPDYFYEFDDEEDDIPFDVQWNSNDQYKDKLWHLDLVRAEKAWQFLDKINHGRTRVAVLDTGLYVNHEDLQSNVNYTLSWNVASTANSRLTQDVHGTGHGTHVVGIIGATSNNGKGTAGVASGSKNNLVEIIAVNIFVKTSTGGIGAYDSDIAEGLYYARDKGARVVNMSIGGYRADKVLDQAVADMDKAGVIIVAAAGNDASTNVSYPGGYSTTLSISATGKNDTLASYSNYGSTITFAAPGTGISSTIKNNNYGAMSGTSMATPVVTGVIAMMLDANPNLTYSEVRKILRYTARDVYSSGWDQYTGYGIVDAELAVAFAYAIPTSVTKVADGAEINMFSSKSGGLAVGESAQLYTDRGELLRVINGSNPVWKTSNANVIKVDSKGKITAVAPGTAKITCTAGAYSISANIEVETDLKKICEVGGNKCQFNSYVVGTDAGLMGKSYPSIVRVDSPNFLPAASRPINTSIIARSDNTMCVQWNKCTGVDGYIVLRRVGASDTYSEVYRSTSASTQYFIDKTANKANTNYYYICVGYKKQADGTIKISNCSMSVVGITANSTKKNAYGAYAPTINYTSKTIYVGGTVQLKLNYSSRCFSAWTRWRSEKSAIAKVSSTGLVTGVSPGTTLISGRTPDGRDIRCTITVR